MNGDGGKCVKHGKKVDLQNDHGIPISKGGNNRSENIPLLYSDCNLKKNDRIQ
ncbi:MAG: HNH endonuclease [Candidatus Lokiarchaeota archaeon]|nr:HNH endonuclease [Candidatus Lokiarchaeota archaeon]